MKKLISFLCIFFLILFLYQKKFKNKNQKLIYQNKIEAVEHKPENQFDKTLELSSLQAKNDLDDTNDLSIFENKDDADTEDNIQIEVDAIQPLFFENAFTQENDLFAKNLKSFVSISQKNEEPKIENEEETQILENIPPKEEAQEEIVKIDEKTVQEEENKNCEELPLKDEIKEEIDISKKKLSQISIINNCHTKEDLIKKRMKLKPGDYINQQKLQQHLNFINLNPFRKIEAVLEDEKDNKCRLELLCHDRSFFRPYIGTDNTGLKLIDRERIYAGFNLNNAFNIDSILSYQYIASYNLKTFQAHTGNYSIYLPWENIFTVFGVYADIDVDHKIPTIEKNNGFNLQASARYDVCLPIMKNLTHDLILGFDFKRTDTNLLYSDFIATDDTTVNLSQVLLSYHLNWHNSFYNTKFFIEYYFSLGDWLPDQSDTRYNNLRTFAKNDYLYVRAELCNLFRLPKDFLFSLIIKGQASNENLLPSEMLGVGGYNSVRGYYERETNGDSGLIINTEIRTPQISLLRKVKDGFSCLVFFDYGLASLHKATSSEEKNQHLVGFGPGFRYVISTHLAARFDWGIRGKKSTQNERENSLIHFSCNLSY